MLDWGFGRGRSARTGLRLPAYVAPASVTALLVRQPRTVARHRPPAAGAASTPTRQAPATGAGPAGPDGWASRAGPPPGARVATGAGAVAALLAGGFAVRRRRRARP